MQILTAKDTAPKTTAPCDITTASGVLCPLDKEKILEDSLARLAKDIISGHFQSCLDSIQFTPDGSALRSMLAIRDASIILDPIVELDGKKVALGYYKYGFRAFVCREDQTFSPFGPFKSSGLTKVCRALSDHSVKSEFIMDQISESSANVKALLSRDELATSEMRASKFRLSDWYTLIG